MTYDWRVKRVIWEAGNINDLESAGANNTFENNVYPDVIIPQWF